MKHRARIERLLKAGLSQAPEKAIYPTREQWDALYRDQELSRELRDLVHAQMIQADLEEAILVDAQGRLISAQTKIVLSATPSARLVQFLRTGKCDG